LSLSSTVSAHLGANIRNIDKDIRTTVLPKEFQRGTILYQLRQTKGEYCIALFNYPSAKREPTHQLNEL